MFVPASVITFKARGKNSRGLKTSLKIYFQSIRGHQKQPIRTQSFKTKIGIEHTFSSGTTVSLYILSLLPLLKLCIVWEIHLNLLSIKKNIYISTPPLGFIIR